MNIHYKNETYLIRVVEELPEQGSKGYLYSLRKDNLGVYYRWKDNATWEKTEISTPVPDPIDLSTGLEAIDEGNGIGWRLKGRNPDNYGNIGLNAIDLGASNSPSTMVGATGFYSTVGGGYENKATNHYSTVGGGDKNTASGFHSTVGGGNQNEASGGYSIVGGGYQNEASGRYSTVSGGWQNIAKTFGEFLGGLWSTIKEGNATAWIGTDRIFGIGNGKSLNERSDAFNVYKNGVAELPSVTNSLIDSAGAKTIPTKEWVENTKQPKDLVYPTIAAMIAAQAVQVEGVVIRVDDASADTNITFPSGETKLQAYYKYNGIATGSLVDYTLISAPYTQGFTKSFLIERESLTQKVKPTPAEAASPKENDIAIVKLGVEFIEYYQYTTEWVWKFTDVLAEGSRRANNEETDVKFDNIFGTWVGTPEQPITTSTISLNNVDAVNGAICAIYYKGDVLTKTSFINQTITFLTGENVANELCIIWIIYDKNVNGFYVNIQTGFTGDFPVPVAGEPISPEFTSDFLTKEDVNYKSELNLAWGNCEVTTTDVGRGDFEFYISLDESTPITIGKPMIGLSTSNANTSFSTEPKWEVAAFLDTTVFKVLANGTSDGTLTQTSLKSEGSGMMLRRIGSTISLIKMELGTEELIHTFSISISSNVFLHIVQNQNNRYILNPLYRQL